MRFLDGRRVLLVAIFAMLIAALAALPAAGRPPGTNGRIVFGRFDPNLGDTVFYTINPDGTHEEQVLPETLECPHWSPDGTRISTCGADETGSSRIINPDDHTYRIVPNPDPEHLFLPCFVWSRDGTRLACEGFGLTDDSLNGIYTVRSSDGGGLVRVTSTPGGDDIPGDSSPDGNRLVFNRGSLDALFVVNTNGTGLKEITPTRMHLSSDGDWSPQGNEIIFSRHVTPNARSTIWVVHSNGTGLHQISVQAEPSSGGPIPDPTSLGCFGPRWSPDGTKIIFSRGTSGDFDANIYTANADGSGLTQVTHGGRDQNPDWGIHPLVS